MDEAVKKAVEHNPELAEKYEAYQTRSVMQNSPLSSL
jgi:hypothetical protein